MLVSVPATPWGDANRLLARRLRPGPGASRETVAADQRERLFAALAVLSEERGYAALRVEDLIARAGISRGAFYAQFGSREDCLVAAVAAIAEPARAATDAAASEAGDPHAGGRLAAEALTQFAAAQPTAARLWLVDAAGAGPEAAEQAQVGTASLRELLTAPGGDPEGASGTDAAGGLPPPLAAALTGALERVLARRLRLRREQELPTLAAPLAAWISAYEPPPAPLRRPRAQAGATEGPRFTPRDQVERIILGTCEAVYEKGYAATTLADVAKHAATSIRTLYAHYEGKEEAFVDAIDLAQAQSDAAARAAARRAADWPHAVRNALHATCGYYATEPALAEAVLVEAPAAGERALARREEATDALVELLEPGRYELAPATPPIASEAIAGAFETLLHDAQRAGGGAKLRAVAPVATYLALSPFVGAAEAATVANDIGQPRRRRM
jgi:AcrR family transcriptional regulator